MILYIAIEFLQFTEGFLCYSMKARLGKTYLQQN